MAYTVMAYTVMAYILWHIVMAYVLTAYIGMAYVLYGLYRYALYSYALYSYAYIVICPTPVFRGSLSSSAPQAARAPPPRRCHPAPKLEMAQSPFRVGSSLGYTI